MIYQNFNITIIKIDKCIHSKYDIEHVQASRTNGFFGIGCTKYCIIANCSFCKKPMNQVLNLCEDLTTKENKLSEDAAVWLVKNNFDFITGKPIKPIKPVK